MNDTKLSESNGEPESKRRTARRFTDEQKAQILAQLNGTDTSKAAREVMKAHRVQAHQVAKWRAQAAQTAYADAPVRKPRARAEAAKVISAKDVAAYLLSLEGRVAALEKFELKLSKLLGGR